MSEKYGDCLRCKGRGVVADFTKPIKQTTIVDGNETEVTTYEPVECPRCGGTGFEGSLLDSQGFQGPRGKAPEEDPSAARASKQRALRAAADAAEKATKPKPSK